MSADRRSPYGPGDTIRFSFGFVADVALDREDNLFVLDDRLGTVTVFSSQSALGYSIGAPGNGAGQFTDPSSLAVAENGDLYVSDFGRRLHVFRKTKTGYAPGQTYRIDIPIEDLCVLGGRIIIHSRPLNRPELLYVLNDSGAVIKSFGELYRSPNPHVNREIARGKISCSTPEGVILYAPAASIVPELRAYGIDGRLRWITRYEGHVSTEMIQPRERPTAMRAGVPAGGAHSVHAVTYDGKGNFLVQIAFASNATSRRRGGYDDLLTFVVSALDGRGVLLSRELSGIGAMSRMRVVFVHNHPQPTLISRSLRLRSAGR
jgi:hypothetical protein